MEIDPIQRLKAARFTEVRRGYDRDEVQRFIAELTAWLEPRLQEPKEKTTGEKVAGAVQEIILVAERSAAEIRQSAEAQAAELVDETRRRAGAIRQQADAEARALLEETHQRANEIRAAAKVKADEQRTAAERRAGEAIRSAKAEVDGRRRDAAQTAKAQLDEADAEARHIVREAEEDRRDLETMVIALERRRKAVHQGLDKIRRALAELPGEADS